MSYDISLVDPVTRETLEVESPHQIRGGNYVLGGTSAAWLNITYNYGRFYREVFGEKGIRTIYGMTGAESIPVIKAAMDKLAGLLAFAQMRPDGVWDGD